MALARRGWRTLGHSGQPPLGGVRVRPDNRPRPKYDDYLRIPSATAKYAIVWQPKAGKPVFLPYLRDPEVLARPWAIPGTAGLQHRIGGIEKAKDTGAVSYDPANHEEMVRTRQAKINGIVRDIPDLTVDDPADSDGKRARVLVLGWGSTYGQIVAAARRVRKTGRLVAYTHLRHLNPFPANLGDILRSYDRVIVPEMNTGQLAMLLRAKYLVDVHSYSRVRGLPISLSELALDLEAEIDQLEGTNP